MRKILFVFFLFSFSSLSYSLDFSEVYSVVNGKPVFAGDAVNVSTITRKMIDNKMLYRPIVQVIPKSVFMTAFRRTLGITPYGIAALAALELYDYFIDSDTGELMQNPASTGACYMAGNYKGVLTSSECILTAYQIWPASTIGTPHLDNSNVSGPQSILDKNNSYLGYWNPSTTSTTEPTPVLDNNADFWQKVEDYVNNDTITDQSTMFYNNDGTINKEFFPKPTFDVYTATETELMDLYGSGLLQSTDPASSNYVTPAEFQHIKDLYDQANKPIDQVAEDLEAEANKPITQAQHRSNQLGAEQRKAALTASENSANIDGIGAVDISNLDKTQEMDDGFDLLNNAFTGISTSNLPSVLPTLPQLNTGSCQSMSVNFFGNAFTFPDASQCAKLTNLKTLFGYAFYVIFVYMITIELLKEAN